MPDKSIVSSPSSLINLYCTVSGLKSPSAARYNGCVCYVSKVDPDDATRLAVLFRFDIGIGSGKCVSLRPANLTPLFGVEVRPSTLEGCGKGLFATRAYKKGEVLFTESPMLAVKDRSLSALGAALGALSPAEIEVLEGFTLGAPLSEATAAKLPADVALWYRRVRSNAHGGSGVLCLYPLLCRINHGCSATVMNNVWWCGTGKDNLRALAAVRDIAAGEELFADYCWTTFDATSRAGKLAGYGIVDCECGLCSPTVAMDECLTEYKQKMTELSAQQLRPVEEIDATYAKLIGIVDEFEAAWDLSATTAMAESATTGSGGDAKALADYKKLHCFSDTIRSNLYSDALEARGQALSMALVYTMRALRDGPAAEGLIQYVIEKVHRPQLAARLAFCGDNAAHPSYAYMQESFADDLAFFEETKAKFVTCK